MLSVSIYAQPRLVVVGGSSIEFGNIYHTKSATREIQILNSGSQTLTITGIETFCSCTKAKISSKSIPPNSNAVLALTFSGKTFQGSISKAIHVKSNDASSPVTPIMFTANVYKLVEVNPDYVFFGTFPAGSSVIKTLKLKNVSPNVLKILKVSSKDSFISGRVKDEVLPLGGETELIVSAAPNRPLTLQGELILTTDSKIDPKIKVKYAGLATQKR